MFEHIFQNPVRLCSEFAFVWMFEGNLTNSYEIGIPRFLVSKMFLPHCLPSLPPKKEAKPSIPPSDLSVAAATPVVLTKAS